jgi:predicted tellurium resistance membrane protein TerC
VHERHRSLTYGIVGALVLRAVFIVAGAALLAADAGGYRPVTRAGGRPMLTVAGAALAAIEIADLLFAV